MKKFYKTTLTILTIFLLFGCTTKINMEEEKTNTHYDVVFLVNEESIYCDHNDGVYEGINQYCDENDLSCTYLQPELDSDDNRETVINQALDDYTADTIVISDNSWNNKLLEKCDKYPDVKFILINCSFSEEKNNVIKYEISKQDCGFLTGYVLTAEGYDNLGYIGTDEDDKFFLGFVEGAEYAAETIDEYIYPNIKYINTNEDISSCFKNEDIDVIYACGKITDKVVEIAEPLDDKYVVTNMNNDSKTVLFKSLLDLKKGTYTILKQALSNQLNTNNVVGVEYNASVLNGVSRLTNFTVDDYQALCLEMIDIERVSTIEEIDLIYVTIR